MIELYTFDNLDQPYAKLPVISGDRSAERNGYYKLSFSVLNQYLEKMNIEITPRTIFKAGGLFYATTDTGQSDERNIMKTFSAELVQTQVLMFSYIDEIKLENTTAIEVLTQILEPTIFEVGICDTDVYFPLELKDTNAQAVLSKVVELTKGELQYDGLRISIRKSNWNEASKIVVKGRDFTTLDENTDLSDVVTRLHYQSSDGKLSGSIDSEYLSKYGFAREGYQEFDADSEGKLSMLAQAYLETVELPSCSLSISIPKIRKLSLEIGEVVKIHNTLLDEDMAYKVIGYQKSLTKSADTYQLGERKKDFTDIEQMIEDKTEEVVQEVVQDVIVEVVEQEVITANTAHILNAWIRDLNVEFLETNFDALDARKEYPEGGIRNFIRVKEKQIEFVTQTLSETETQNYMNKDGDQIYYTAIDEHPQAYKYFTITSPTSIYPNLIEEEIDGFKVKVRKVLTESVKAAFEFGLIGNTQYPLMRWGIGTDVSGTTNNGKGFIYKELDGLVLKYITSTGVIHQIKLGENGVEGIGSGETIVQNINMGGLIEIPGQALTKASFNDSGVVVEHGETTTTFTWTKDSEGKITSLYNSQTGLTVPISWS